MYYSETLLLHTWIRWVVLLAGFFALARALAGWTGARPWTRTDDRSGLWFTLSLDLQMLLGFLLYFAFSPFTAEALQDFGAAMRDPGLRFWAVEHVFGMILGVALAHVGRARVRKVDGTRKHRTAAIFFGLALIPILASIPWPGREVGRPLWWW